MDILSSKGQYHQQNTLIQWEAFFIRQLSTNYTNFQQEYDLTTKMEQSKKPTKLYSSLFLTPKTAQY